VGGGGGWRRRRREVGWLLEALVKEDSQVCYICSAALRVRVLLVDGTSLQVFEAAPYHSLVLDHRSIS